MTAPYELPMLESEELRCMLLQLTSQQGVSIEHLLDGTNVSETILTNPHYRLTQSQEVSLYIRVAHLNKNPYLGIEVGKNLGLASHGMLGFAMATSATFGEALNILTEFGRMINLNGNLSKEYNPLDSTFSLVLSSTPMDVTTQALEAETTFASLHALFTHITEKKICFERVEFAHHCTTTNQQPYIDLFGGRVYFSQATNRIILPMSMLHEKLSHGNSLHSQIIRDLCRSEMESWVSKQDFVTSVKQFFLNQPDGFPSPEKTASHFSISTRSLRRRLAGANTSFFAIADETKHQAACRYLSSTRLTIDSIAKLLGYSEARSFRIAFKKWTNITPSEHRVLNKNN